MKDDFESLFPPDLVEKPFKDNNEYLNMNLTMVKMLLNDYLEAKEDGKLKSMKNKCFKKYTKAYKYIHSRVIASGTYFLAGEYLKRAYKFNNIDWFCVLVGVLIKLDNKYEKLFLKIENNEKLTYDSVLKLYYFTDSIFDINNYSKVCMDLSQKMVSLCFSGENLKIDSRIFENIVNNAGSDQKVPGMRVQVPTKLKRPLVIREDLARKITDHIEDSLIKMPIFFYLKGMKGIGKKTIAGRVCDILDKSLIFVNFDDLPLSAGNVLSFVDSAYREALFEKGYICLQNLETVISKNVWNERQMDYVFRKALNFAPIVFVLSDAQEGEEDIIRPYLEKYRFIDIYLDELNSDENFEIWKDSLEQHGIHETSDLDFHEMANKFTFTPKQIVNTAIQVKNQSAWNNDGETKNIDKKFLCETAYKQITGKISDKAVLIKKKHSWDELVMKKDQKEIIRRACNQIKYKHIVYDKWGMNKRVLYGRGLSMLFTGPPGTGKTMAAQVVANELELEIYKVDLSKVISKYIGESEKNLGEVFDSAKRSNVILLFDEMDALFGKRTEVKDSHDKHANVETSYLLQKMEEYNGITIMTTNFIENIDKAFFRRINYVINFHFPDVASRKEIWIKMFPKETPLDKDIDFDFLAKQFEIAGGNIKNSVITATFMAASESKKVSMKHILKALEYEIRKQGRLVSKSDFGEYGYLLKA